MPSTHIAPNENIRMRYSPPKDGLIEFEVTATRPVKTYVMRPGGLKLFDEGRKTFRYYGGFQEPPRRTHRQELLLPFSGAWYLVIMNPDKHSPVTVDYEVYYTD